MKGGVGSSFDSQTPGAAGDRPAPRRLSVCASARESPAVPSELEARGVRAVGPVRGRALESTLWGARLPGAPDPRCLFGPLKLEPSETPWAVCHPCRRITDSRRHSSQKSFPEVGDTCSEQKRAIVQPARPGPPSAGIHITWTLLQTVPNFSNNNGPPKIRVFYNPLPNHHLTKPQRLT